MGRARRHAGQLREPIPPISAGWTTPASAAAYDQLLKREIFPEIESRRPKGYLGIELLRRDLEDEVEFVTIMWFRSIDAVREFAGEDYQVAYVPGKARSILKRYDARSAHYHVSKPGAFDEAGAYVGRWY